MNATFSLYVSDTLCIKIQYSKAGHEEHLRIQVVSMLVGSLCESVLYFDHIFLCLRECSYRPTVTVEFLEQRLGFTERQQCVDFLDSLPSLVYTADRKLDCKLSSMAEPQPSS